MRQLYTSLGALSIVCLGVSWSANADPFPSSMMIDPSQVQALLDDGWQRLGPVVLFKDLNGDGKIEQPDEVRVIVDPSVQH